MSLMLFTSGPALWAMLLIAGLTLGSLLSGKIDLPGALTGGVLTSLMWLGASWLGIGLIFSFFVLGTLVSLWKKQEKERLGLAQEDGGKRSFRHAFANGGVAGLCGLLAWLLPEQAPNFVIMMAASMAAATSDTFSSELGNVYGRRYVSITSFRPGKRGDDGIISAEGTWAGVLGAGLIALLFGAWHESGWALAMLVGFAGLLGNLQDSLLGATLQQRGWLSNDAVNFCNTLGAALFAGGLVWIYNTL
jgi:uncharacterized protein (TIGR00297 family)